MREKGAEQVYSQQVLLEVGFVGVLIQYDSIYVYWVYMDDERYRCSYSYICLPYWVTSILIIS